MRLLLVLLLCSTAAAAQGWNKMVPKDIVILRSTKDYKLALQTAQDAAKKLHKPLDLESNHPQPAGGLTLTRTDCEGSGYEYPCYLARGDGGAENSDFISIEYSSAYEGFAPDYYIVVAGVGQPGSTVIRRIATAARTWYPDAYAKRTRVWFGCMH